MFCHNCGKENNDENQFCVNCGTKLCGNENSVVQGLENTSTMDVVQKIGNTKKKRIKFSVMIFALLVLCAIGIIHLTIDNPRAEFDVECSEDGMNNFMRIVCRNVKGKVESIEAHVGSDTWGYNYYTTVKIKPEGKIAESATIEFYNFNDSDTAGQAHISIFDPESENEYNCEKELIMALERTLSGSTTADKYITTYNEMRRLAHSDKAGEIVEIAEYWLTDDLYVRITAGNFGSMSWHVYYNLYTRERYRTIFGEYQLAIINVE